MEKVLLTGNKSEKKEYESYSGWMGGRKVITAKEVREKNPERMIQDAVRGMIPKNRLGRAQFRKLKVFAGPEHNHDAQKPEPLEIKG